MTMKNRKHEVVRLGRERFDETVATLCRAFHEYPVMRYILGNAGNAYDEQLTELIAYFTDSRVSRGWPVLGVDLDGRLAAAANVNPARSEPAPPALEERFRKLCALVGPKMMDRFAAFAEATEPFRPAGPHCYLGMIGVLPECQGHGLGRVLLDEVHDLSDRDPASHGVALTTELPENVGLYEHFGYRVLGHARLGDLETWLMFRPD